MKAAYALYSDPVEAQRAVASLTGAGIPREAIVVMSPEPLEPHGYDPQDRPARMGWFAVLGGVIGCVVGASMTSMTQLLWPLRTGGMPIVSVWPNLIVAFELTMLGAIVATVIALIRSAGLGRRLPAFYDRSASQDRVLVGVADPADAQVPDIERSLAGGEFKTVA